MSEGHRELVSRQDAIEAGLKKYFTGEECKHGHVAERYTLNSGCVACINEKTERTRVRIRQQQVKAAAGEV